MFNITYKLGKVTPFTICLFQLWAFINGELIYTCFKLNLMQKAIFIKRCDIITVLSVKIQKKKKLMCCCLAVWPLFVTACRPQHFFSISYHPFAIPHPPHALPQGLQRSEGSNPSFIPPAWVQSQGDLWDPWCQEECCVSDALFCQCIWCFI